MTERLVELFLSLVSIDSPSGKEQLLRSHVLKLLQKQGISYRQDAYGNVLAFVNCTENPPLTFACHLDTVPNAVGVKAIIQEGVIHSDGTTALGADDKIAVALALLLAENKDLYGPFGLLFTVGEEEGLLGAKNLDPSLFEQLHQVYVFDTGRPVGTAIIQAPCKLDIRLVFMGKAAHAGVTPELGISAISIASKAIDSMKLLRIDETTTANIGSIHGGVSTNVVCDRVEVSMEIRSLEQERAFRQLEEVRLCCSEACRQIGGRFTLDSELSYEGYRIESSPALSRFKAACADLNLPMYAIPTGGGSDANILRAKGIDAVLLGCGYEKAHSSDERIAIKEIKNMVALANQLLLLSKE
ncbi:MAG TPA: M20/M25/M40 family metallo-hydrolase [Sphaerochaeta sp.]|jgi:tripeptide aminopeptidase|nr:M20/M25/M40 family metallo-hydrolase [Sphaerochaeta sp.]